MQDTRTDEGRWRKQMEQMLADERALYRPWLTDFLDPRQQHVLRQMVERNDQLQVCFDGGYAQAERKRALVYGREPATWDEAFGLALLVIQPKTNARESLSVDHGDYLGATLGLGIKREKIGDVLVFRECAYVVFVQSLVPFVLQHLRQVGSHDVDVATCSWDRIAGFSPAVQEVTCTVASMRLDGIVGEVYHLSRSRVNVPIKAGRCKVNWQPVLTPATTVHVGDTISLQGFGRFRVVATNGTTRSGRIRLTVEKFV